MPKAYEITAENKRGVGLIRIVGRITEWNGEELLRDQVRSLIAEGVKDAHLYINTQGGSVFQANGIVNVLAEFPGNVTGEGGALVASAGSYISLHIPGFEMPSNGQYMYHKPIGGASGNEDEIESQLVLLKNLTSEYRKKLSEKMSITENELEAKWSKGDVWLTAEKAKKAGLISKVKPAIKVSAEDVEFVESCGAPNALECSIEEKYKNNNRGMVITAQMVGLQDGVSDAKILAAFNALQAKANGYDGLKRDQEEADKNKIKAEGKDTVAQAVKDKKIAGDQVAQWEAQYEKDPIATKKLLEGLQAVVKPEVAQGSAGAQATERKEWTYADYQEKDPEALDKMNEDEPDKFEALMEAHYKD